MTISLQATINSSDKSSIPGFIPFRVNPYYPGFISLKEAAIKTGRKESSLRNLAKNKHIRWYKSGGGKTYFFIEQEIKKDIAALPPVRRHRPKPKDFKSSFTRLEFALLYSALVKQQVLPDHSGGKLMFCQYLVSLGVYSSTTTAQKMFSDFDLQTTQTQSRIKKRLIQKLSSLINSF